MDAKTLATKIKAYKKLGPYVLLNKRESSAVLRELRKASKAEKLIALKVIE